MSVQFDLSGQVVAITGAAIGIGAAAAAGFARAGAEVFVLDIDDERGTTVAGSIGDRAVYVHCDVTQATSIAETFDIIARRHDRLDVLVNNAGGFGRQGTTEDTTEDEWDRVIDVNLKSVFLCTRAAIPLLRRARNGRIINVGSLAGQTTMYRSSPAYSAAKAGVHALTRVFAWELAEDGIRVNAIAPSLVATERITRLRGPQEREASAASALLRRYADPEEVADVMLWLASDKSSFVTGQTISVNGGRFMI